MKYKLLFLLLTTVNFLNAQVTANAGPDRFICQYDTLKVTGTGLNSGDTGTYQWKDLNSNIVVSNNSSFSAKITILATRNYELTVTRIHNMATYIDTDTFSLTVSPLPIFKFKGLPPRCFDDGCINLTFNIIASTTQGNDTSKKIYDVRYFQKYKNPSWVTGGPVGTAPYKYCPGNFITNSQLPSSGLRDTICYEYEDVNGCYNYECKPVRIYPNPEVMVNNGLYCQKVGLINLNSLAVVPFNKTSGIQSWRCLKVPAGSGVNPDSIISQIPTNPTTFFMNPGLPTESQKTGEYVLEYCFKNPTTACQRCDTTVITVIRLPEIKFSAIPGLCINGPQVPLDSFVFDSLTGKRFPSGAWQCVAYGGSRDLGNPVVKNALNNSVQSQKYFNPGTNPNGGQYLLKFTDLTSGCLVSDSVYVNVNGLPLVSLNVPDSVCSSSGRYPLRSNYSSTDTNGWWTGQFTEGDEFNSDSVEMGAAYSMTSKVKFSYKHPLTNCVTSDSQYITVIKRPYFKFVQTIKLNSKFLVTFNIIDSNMNLSPFKWYWDYGNGITGFDRNQKEILFLDSGVYDTYLSIDNGVCVTSDSISFLLNYRTSSISKMQLSSKIYPNPVVSVLYLDIPFDSEVHLSDINGKQVMETSVRMNEIRELDLSWLAKGIYILDISNDKFNNHLKLMKE